jgi:hypothetical protein
MSRDLSKVAGVTGPSDFQMRREKNIKPKTIKKIGIAFQSCLYQQAGLMRCRRPLSRHASNAARYQVRQMPSASTQWLPFIALPNFVEDRSELIRDPRALPL